MCTPALAIAAAIGSAGIFIAGQQQQAQAARQQAAYRNAILSNQRKVIAQDIQTEKENQQLRLQLIGEAGKQQAGKIRVAAARLGQQLTPKSSAEGFVEELAGEVAFKKLISDRDSKNRIRNFEIASGSIEGAMGLNDLRSEAAQSAANMASFGTVLTTGFKLASTFEVGTTGTGARELRFRTKRIT